MCGDCRSLKPCQTPEDTEQCSEIIHEIRLEDSGEMDALSHQVPQYETPDELPEGNIGQKGTDDGGLSSDHLYVQVSGCQIEVRALSVSHAQQNHQVRRILDYHSESGSLERHWIPQGFP